MILLYVGHSCRTLFRNTLVGLSCRTLLQDTLVGHSFAALLYGILVGPLVKHLCRTLMWAPPLQSPNVNRHVLESHTSSLQNEHFARDFFQNSLVKSYFLHKSHVKVSKTRISHETSSAPATKCDLRHTAQPHDSLCLPRKMHVHTSKPAQGSAPVTKSDKTRSC